MKKLLEAIGKKINFSAELESHIITSFTKEEVPKNHQLLREGQYANRLFFLERGVVRTFYYHQDKEVTSWLYGEEQFFTSWYSFIARKQSFECIETLEKCTLHWITKEKYDKLIASHPKLEKFSRLLVEEQLAFLDYFYQGYLFKSAKEKYDLLLSVFPTVTQRVNLGQIASLLGITQETLSRIRKLK